MIEDNKQILTQLVERKIGNILDSTDVIVSSLCGTLVPHMPMVKTMAINAINAKKEQQLPKIQQWSDLLVETSFLDPNISLDQAIKNAEGMINEYISNWIGSNTGLPNDIIKISLPALLGADFLKL